jgi:hypothetical protein
MRQRMIVILAEELGQADVSARVEVPAQDERNYGAPGILGSLGRTMPGPG